MTKRGNVFLLHLAKLSAARYDECSFTKSLEKKAAEGVRLPMSSAAYVTQSKVGRE